MHEHTGAHAHRVELIPDVASGRRLRTFALVAFAVALLARWFV
jgi:hypothetical protein